MKSQELLLKYVPNILIVDDIPANLKVLGDILRGEGFKVRPVPSGKLALHAAEKGKPDLILLDIMMPEMDGYQICVKLKENEILKDVPVIFISSLNDTDNIVKAFTSGGVDYITKPFKAEEVIARVCTHLQISMQNRELIELNADKDRFISILAHDLRNPIHTLLGFSELLTSSSRTSSIEEIESFSEHIYKAGHVINDLLESLLFWARAKAGKISYDPQIFSFSSLCISTFLILEPGANAKNISLKQLTPTGINVFADYNMINTVLRNLVSNAIKFSNSGGLITISAEQNQKTLTVSVSDNGIGIKPENLSKLFDISQSHTTTGTANESGTGLGLLICKEFVEKHGGKIWVDSEAGKGSNFKFTLQNLI